MPTNVFSVQNLNFFLVFLEGLLSFFSPCVLPLIPIYVSYLAGNTAQELPDGSIQYDRKKVLWHTIFFILGISFAFFILGFSFSAIGVFFGKYKIWFTRIGGIIILLLGLFQIGVFDLKFLQQERKIHLPFDPHKMNPLAAFLMGFTFSFAWTPCVGPALSSVLILASSAQDSLLGNLLVLLYALGFVIPFLLLGLFTTQVLNFLKRKQKVLKYAIKIGGVILIFIGLMTITGFMNRISGYLNSYTPQITPAPAASSEPSPSPEPEAIPALDFTLVDQYAVSHTLSQYKGKVIFLNFWATWCGPCRQEMPHIEQLYHEYGENKEDVVFLGVSNPGGQEKNKEGVISFLEDNQYTFPTVFDESGEIYAYYGIQSFPTTFMIDREGNIFGYVPGSLTKDMMQSIIEQTLNGKRGQP